MKKTWVTGFSLIEILIALLMVAVITLGLIRWQVASVYAARQTEAFANAMRFASELADWIRIIPEEITRFSNTEILDLLNQPPTNLVASCFYSHCNADQQIEFDILEWHLRLQQALPGARVVVCHDDQLVNLQMHSWPCHVTKELTAPLVIKIGWHRPAYAETLPLLVLAVGTAAL